MQGKTVCILLSDKRSGSTMFQTEICKHPQIQTVAYSPHTYLETHHWLKGAVITGAAKETFSGGRTYAGYGSLENARQYTIDCILGNVPNFTIPENNKKLIFDGWEALCTKFAQPVFFEKSPQYIANWASLSLILEWAQQTKFTVKFIGLTRNPLSVQYSAFKLFYTNPQQRQYGWLENQRNLLAFQNLVPNESFLAVKYEDIISDPKKSFTRIFDFLGVQEYSIPGKGTHKNSLEKWKTDPEFRLNLDPAVVQIAKRYGYSNSNLFNPEKPPLSKVKEIKRAFNKRINLFKTRLRDRVVIPVRLKIKNK